MRSTWRAETIRAATRPPKGERVLWSADFSDRGVDGSSGIDGLTVRDGVLRFVTKKGGAVHWGDFTDRQPEAR